jgi:MFS family permease
MATRPITNLAEAASRSAQYKWAVVAVFWCVYFLNQADRQIVFSVFPLLQREMGLSNTQLGLLGSSFQWIYAILVPIAGGLGDITSRRNQIALALLVWSAATFASGFAGGFFALLVLRAITGAGEAFYYPAAASIIADYHGQKTRALALSFHQTSVYIGIVCSGALAGYVGQLYGWRIAFITFGAAGVMLAAIVQKVVKEPRRGQADSDSKAVQAVPLSTRLAEILAHRTVVLLMLAFVGMNFVNVACLAWTPTLLYEKFQLSLAESGFHATFYHHLGAFLGVLAGGRLADRWASRSRITRPLIQTAGLALGAPFVFLVGSGDSTTAVFVALGLFGLFRGLYDSNLFASLYEVVRPEARATATGLMLSVGFLGGGSSALVIGWLSQEIPLGQALSLTSLFYIVAAATLAVACIFFRADAARVQMRMEPAE